MRVPPPEQEPAGRPRGRGWSVRRYIDFAKLMATVKHELV